MGRDKTGKEGSHEISCSRSRFFPHHLSFEPQMRSLSLAAKGVISTIVGTAFGKEIDLQYIPITGMGREYPCRGLSRRAPGSGKIRLPLPAGLVEADNRNAGLNSRPISPTTQMRMEFVGLKQSVGS